MQIEKDRSFLLAERYVQETGVSVYLTGKAGTGKTTFLKEIVANTSKRCAIVAPTGVAAMNAGGVTIHSFFQLPLCPYLPDVKELVTEYQMPERNRTLRRERIKILRTLDLLVIDEISMVRADILDAMDYVLRTYRRNDRPFGGVQLLMIGDIQQLPPVIKDSERPYFEQVYPSPFFFNSKAFRKLPHVIIELERIHRQKDAEFLSILNDIRTGTPHRSTLAALNTRYDPSFIPPEDEKWIRLTTHNAQADAVNRAKMEEIDSEERIFEARVDGTFPENAYPADTELSLKVGAQVMFIRNDVSGEGRYYNGKIGTVSALDKAVTVTDEYGTEIVVEEEEWENMKYELNPVSGEIEGKVEGVFRQYPLRLAWAITIHKSQGLTFDRVMIDAGSAFSFGQVYVALSRCRSLDGIVLATPITERCTFSNQEVNTFEQTYTPQDVAAAELEAHRREYTTGILCDAFDLRQLRYLYNRVNRVYQVDLSNLYPEQAGKFKGLAGKDGDSSGIRFLSDTALKFQAQIRRIVSQEPEGTESGVLDGRVRKGAAYFKEQLTGIAAVMAPLMLVEIDSKAVKKAFAESSRELLKELRLRMDAYSSIAENGFDLKAFLRMKTASELSDDVPVRKQVKALEAVSGMNEEKVEERDVYSDNRHPEVVTALSNWRTLKYKEMGVPAFTILSQKALLGIADAMPSCRKEFLKVKGFGEKKWEQYGSELLEIVDSYRESAEDLLS